MAWDSKVTSALDSVIPGSSENIHPDPVLIALVVVVSAIAGALSLWLLVTKRWRSGLFLAGSVAGAVALSSIVKHLVHRPTIEGGAGDYSFPSGTATWSMAVVGAAVLLARSPRARLLFAAVGAGMVLGFAAIIIWEEWHYASDVLAGWCLALGWVALLASVVPPQRSVAAESGAGP